MSRWSQSVLSSVILKIRCGLKCFQFYIIGLVELTVNKEILRIKYILGLIYKQKYIPVFPLPRCFRQGRKIFIKISIQWIIWWYFLLRKIIISTKTLWYFNLHLFFSLKNRFVGLYLKKCSSHTSKLFSCDLWTILPVIYIYIKV